MQRPAVGIVQLPFRAWTRSPSAASAHTMLSRSSYAHLSATGHTAISELEQPENRGGQKSLNTVSNSCTDEATEETDNEKWCYNDIKYRQRQQWHTLQVGHERGKVCEVRARSGGGV
ncbi:hypothetical protein VTO73DRAFT_14865 [Trametes versicolor]